MLSELLYSPPLPFNLPLTVRTGVLCLLLIRKAWVGLALDRNGLSSLLVLRWVICVDPGR